MQIQLSVLIWTVICFGVLMLVLDRLLFKPLLAFMDARRAKIDAARIKREDAEKKHAQMEADAEKERLETEKTALAEAALVLEKAKQETTARVTAAQQDYAVRIEQTRSDMDAQKQLIRSQLDGSMDKLVTAFMERLVQ